MNGNFKNVVIFLFGAGLGALVTNKVLKTKYEQLADEEIDKVRDFYISKQTPTTDTNSVEEWIDYSEKTKKYGNVTEKKDISTVMRERGLIPVGDLDEETNEEEEYERMPIVENLAEPIYIIEEADFFNGYEHHDKLTITYYEGDNMLADERDGIIPVPEDIVGIGTLSSFEDNILYVRNITIGTDFEIVKMAAGYYETVLGVTPPTKEIPKVRSTRSKRKVDNGEA